MLRALQVNRDLTVGLLLVWDKLIGRSFKLRCPRPEKSTDVNRSSTTSYNLNATGVPLNALFEKLDRGLNGIRLYGIAPPKLASDPERLREAGRNRRGSSGPVLLDDH